MTRAFLLVHRTPFLPNPQAQPIVWQEMVPARKLELPGVDQPFDHMRVLKITAVSRAWPKVACTYERTFSSIFS